MNESEFSFEEMLRVAATQPDLRKGARTEARIRWVACMLLGRTSLLDLKVQDICAEAKIAQGTFYQYFPDRDTLLRMLLQEFVRFLYQTMISAARGSRDHATSIEATTRVYCRLFERNRGLMKCLLNHYESFPRARDILHEFNASWIQMTVNTLMKRQITGHDTVNLPLWRTCYALGGMVDQYLASIYLYEDPYVREVAGDQDAIVETLSRIWRVILQEELSHAV